MIAVSLLVACQQLVEEPVAPDHVAQVAKLHAHFARYNPEHVSEDYRKLIEIEHTFK